MLSDPLQYCARQDEYRVCTFAMAPHRPPERIASKNIICRAQETREMLRRDQAKQLHEQDRQKTPRGTGRNSIPSIATSTARSLAAMLADESVVNPGSDPDGEGAHDCASDDGCVGTRRHSGPARSSVSSSWSPPHLPHTPESSATRGGESTDQSQGAEGVIEASVGRDTWEEVNARGISMSASSPWQSDPPTPRMPSLEGREAWTPTSDRRASSSARYSEDRSVGTTAFSSEALRDIQVSFVVVKSALRRLRVLSCLQHGCRRILSTMFACVNAIQISPM